MDRTHSELCHNHIIIIMNDLMAFIKRTSGFLQDTSSTVSHHVCRLINGENSYMKYYLFILGSHQWRFVFHSIAFPVCNQFISNIFNHCEQGDPWLENEWQWVGCRNLSKAKGKPRVHSPLHAAMVSYVRYSSCVVHNNPKTDSYIWLCRFLHLNPTDDNDIGKSSSWNFLNYITDGCVLSSYNQPQNRFGIY